ncbi:MAG: Gfo/Idh/MocA family oxidoreductase [Armatimonadetes bacterium]|nr:Gfo/Idh/MocA family oxidoreductase [Armatimonadota bacterium]
MEQQIRTVVVGYGYAGRNFHSYLIGLEPRLELAGIVARRPEVAQRIADERGCPVIPSLDAALADDSVQLVVVATPNSTHADLACAAMEAGKHVVTDKVMCLSLADCDRMIATAERCGVMLSVFQNRRCDGDYQTVRTLMDSGELGDVRWLELAWQGLRPWGGWRGQAAMGGGRYLDLGAHLVDQLLLLFPETIQSVYGRMDWAYPEFDVESDAHLTVAFEGGRTGIVDVSSMCALSKPRWLVKGTLGTYAKYGLDPQEGAMNAGDIDSAVVDPAQDGKISDGQGERVVPTLRGRWRDYYANIAAVLLDGAAPLVKHHELRRQIAVLEAGRLSAQSGEAVTLKL